MRYAIFSDIQGNRPALQAVLADTQRLRVDTRVCLGDVVGYGPNPQEVLREVRARATNIIMGDCEAAVASLLENPPGNRDLDLAANWNRQHLDRESIQFLSRLPMAVKTDDLLFTHAEALEPSHFGCIDGIEVARANFAPSKHHITFVGHGYHPAVFRMDQDGKVEEMAPGNFQLNTDWRYIVNVGSVGEPRSADELRASYVIYDAAMKALFFRSLAFDADRYRRKLISAGLPLRPWLPKQKDDPRSIPAPDPVPPPVTKREAARQVGVVPASPPAPQGTTPPVTTPPVTTSHHQAPQPVAPHPAPPRRKRRNLLVMTVLPILVIATSITAFVMIRSHEGSPNPDPPAGSSNPPTTTPSSPAPVTPPVAGDPEPGDPPGDHLPAIPPLEPAPEPEPSPEPPAVATVPEPPSTPSAPDPPPAPEPTTPPPAIGRAPLPPEPEHAASTTPLREGLVFYAPFEEDQNEFTARDLAGGRDLDVAGGLPGGLGQVGLACRLEKENDSNALISESKPLPELTSITISFWIKHPDPPVPDDPEESVANPAEAKPAIEPPMTLVSLKDFCEVRLENNQVVANLDRQGEAARLDFPADFRWHHVLVENGEGRTVIWIDHRSQSNPVSESLTAAPASSGAVQIGSKGAHFHIDEVAIWNRKFTPEERQILYRNGRLDQPILSPPKVVASWACDEPAGSRLIQDSTGQHALGIYRSWTPTKGIAPDPVPLTSKPNPLAAQVWQIAERREDAGSFQMKPDAAFTYEGWMKLAPESAVILGGTTAPAAEGPTTGWRLEARPGPSPTGLLAFVRDSGSETVQAISEELPIYDGQPHHFAAIWNPLSSPTHGSMQIYLDNALVATASLLRTNLGPASSEPFRIVATQAPVTLDELRFSSGALQPDEFLTAGVLRSRLPDAGASTDQEPKDESVMERRAREARERREREKAERRARILEEEQKRNRQKLGGD